MISKVLRIFRSAPVLASAFTIALLLTLWFGGQSIARAIYWADPQHQNQEIAGWMTLGYIGRSWGIPPSDMAIAIEPYWHKEPGKRIPPLDVIARERGVPVSEVIAHVEAAIASYQAQDAKRP